MVEKVKQEKVIIITDELLTGNELIEVIKEHKLENHLIERIERQAEFDNPEWDKLRGCNRSKITGYSYVYVFIDKERGRKMDNLLELLEKKSESALNDYNRYLKMPNVEEYKQNALLCRGQYQAYQDIIYHIKTHREEYK